MKRIYGLTAALLLASLTMAPLARAQSTAAAQAARLKRLQDQQAAVLARVKAAQAASSAAAQPTATPTVPPPPPPNPTATTTATVAPKPSATAAASASASAKPVTSASAVPVTSASAAPAPVLLALDIDALRKTRPERRHAALSALQARWGELVSDARAASELKLHAQRSAYLQRIRALAEKAKDTTFVASVDALITKEDARDADAMNALRSGALPAGTAAPAPAPAAGATK
jgi:hypothetical protein